MKNKFGLTIERNTDAYRIVTETIEVRHLIVHNEGKVDGVFVSRTGRSDLVIGTAYLLDVTFAVKAVDSFDELCEKLDSDVARRVRDE